MDGLTRLVTSTPILQYFFRPNSAHFLCVFDDHLEEQILRRKFAGFKTLLNLSTEQRICTQSSRTILYRKKQKPCCHMAQTERTTVKFEFIIIVFFLFIVIIITIIILLFCF